MQLSLKNLLPTYFDESRKNSSEIWGKDVEFGKGELIKIVAPSGSGKSSLMQFLYGIRTEYNGDIVYGGNRLSLMDKEKIASLRKDHISIIFQDLRLFPDLSVFENINIKRLLNPYHPEEKIQEFLNRLGIGSKTLSLCKTCSYGEQQRVAIIRALMQPFDILLLDEPFSHLDNRNAENAMELMLEESRRRNATIIFADLERIEFFPFQKLYHL